MAQLLETLRYNPTIAVWILDGFIEIFFIDLILPVGRVA